MGDRSTELKPLLAKVADGNPLNESEAELAFDIIMSGNATPSQIGAFLMALRLRGETVDEITGAARAMRAKATPIDAPEGAIDVVGTGGDSIGTHNISTATAFVVAGCGIPVAKHGNRAFSSKSGAADVLSALGVDIQADFAKVRQAMEHAHIGFLMAPRHHEAMRNVGPTRVEMGVRTIFNILGPLSNPASVRRLLVGTFDQKWVQPMAAVLGNLGAERAWVVHGTDGMDELSTTGSSQEEAIDDGQIRLFEVVPEDAGLSRASLDDLRGGSPEENATAIRAMLSGELGPLRDIVALNTAAALIVAEKAPDLRTGVKLATEAIDDGRAKKSLENLISIAGVNV